jgi:chemotaxis response regulator CheB
MRSASSYCGQNLKRRKALFETDSESMKILVVDHDETSFQVRRCIAMALEEARTVELIYAEDASEALSIIEKFAPDVVLFNGSEAEEADLLFESLAYDHPPIIFQSDDQLKLPCRNQDELGAIRCIPMDESLEQMHETLKLVISIGEKFSGTKIPPVMH